MMDLDRLAKTGERKGLHDLGAWFVNCLRAYTTRRDDALLVMATIVKEWKRRAHRLLPGIDRERPELGVLKAIGYGVGENGVEESTRRLLIAYLMDADILPPIKDLGHMKEWGEPGSRKRYYKVKRALEYFIEDHRHSPWHDKAIRHWESDLVYLHTRWGFLA